MPSLKVSELSNASLPLTGTELLPISQTGETVKTTVGNVADLAFGNVAAVYEFNTPINKINYNNSLGFIYDALGSGSFPVQVSNNAKTITVYEGITPVTLFYGGDLIQNLSEDLSLKWTVGGGLSFAGIEFAQSDKSFKILETPKTIQSIGIGWGGGNFSISTFNFTTEYAGYIELVFGEFGPSVMDFSSLKICADIFRISFITPGKTLDVSGLEQWGRFGSSIFLFAPFVDIILPTNLKSASNNIIFINCFFTQTAVDAILELFVSLDGTGDKDMWGNDVNITYFLDLSGNNAAPSAAGLANKAILNARLNTSVVTN